MTVLIAKINQQIIKDYLPKVKFKEATKNTCTFNISQVKFNDLYNNVKAAGYNPFALMTC